MISMKLHDIENFGKIHKEGVERWRRKSGI